VKEAVMAIPVLMPKIGLTMTEGRIVEWRKKEGEWVDRGEVLFVFETEKVAFEVEASHAGYLSRILAEVEETVPVGEVVGLLTETADERAERPAGKPGEPVEGAGGGGREPVREETGGGEKRVRATPMARRLARERGIDLRTLSSSGSGGRIRTADLRSAPGTGAAPAIPPEAAGKLVKPSGMRRVIAERMMAGTRDTAHTCMVASIDATGMLEAKGSLAPVVEKETGVRLTITDLLMKTAASAVSAHPILNSRWIPEGIFIFDDIHMGMAMALEEGLIVPVIRDIGRKTVAQIAGERASIVERGKAGTLTPDEMKGSTFTVSSLGMYGVEEFTAIINVPESAILAVGAILDKPVAVNKEIRVRPVMRVTLSYDHRVIDGARAAEFMKTLRERMEGPIPFDP